MSRSVPANPLFQVHSKPNLRQANNSKDCDTKRHCFASRNNQHRNWPTHLRVDENTSTDNRLLVVLASLHRRALDQNQSSATSRPLSESLSKAYVRRAPLRGTTRCSPVARRQGLPKTRSRI